MPATPAAAITTPEAAATVGAPLPSHTCHAAQKWLARL